MKVVFRVDASLKIGSGHVMRCLTLADALVANGARCRFISRELIGNMLDLIRQRGYEVDVLPSQPDSFRSLSSESSSSDGKYRLYYKDWLGISLKKDAEQTQIILQKLRPDWLVVDHYALDESWELVMRPYCKRLMVIDDLADRSHQCDLLLDQNLGRTIEDYLSLVPVGCRILAGPAYALLRREFEALRTYSLERRKNIVPRRLLITMGGVDQPNATGKILQLLRVCALPQDIQITVIMGLNALWVDQVRLNALNMPWPTKVLINVRDMAQCMADSDLAIGAAGSTTWERCCLGLPTLMVVLANNQQAIADALEIAGAGKKIDITTIPSDTCAAISSLIANPVILSAMSIKASQIVRGLGTQNLIYHLSELENS